MNLRRPTWADVTRRTGGIDREAIQWLFATCGVIASVLGLAQPFLPDTSRTALVWWVLAAFAFGIVGGTTLRLVRRSIHAVSSSGRWTIEIVRGDVLSHRPCVITTDRRRTVEVAKVSPGSLMGQYIASLDPARRTALETMVPGDKLVQPGDVLVVDGDTDGPVLLLACGRPTNGGTVTTWPHLGRAYDGLWAAVRANQLEQVTVPVIGAGYSRVNLSHSAVLLALVLSFHAASLERVVCRTLRIVISPQEFDQEALVLTRRFLGALKYSWR